MAIAFGALFGAGVHLMVRRDALKLIGGMVLIGNAAVLFLVSAGFGSRETPLLPVDDPKLVADPLVQALALTALVINFATTVLLLRVALAVERTHDTLDMEDLVQAEVAEEPEQEKGGPAR